MIKPLYQQKSLPIWDFWGDSLTVGFTYTDSSPLKQSRYLYSFCPCGVSGKNANLIKARFFAAGRYHRPCVFWVGTNNQDDPDMSMNALFDMISALTHDRYLVLSPLGGAGNEIGTAQHTGLVEQWNRMASIYGSRFVNVHAALQSANDGSANDLADVANDITPRSLRFDAIHPNMAGRIITYNLIDPVIKSLR